MASEKKKSNVELELIGGVFWVEKFEDGTERREEIDGQAVLQLVLYTLEQVLEKKAPLKEKLSNTRMEYVTRKEDRRKKK